MENKEKIAREFSKLLRQELSDEDMETVNYRNEHEYDDSCCATHDFCDANMVMDQAFKSVMGYSPLGLALDSAARMEAMELWNAAWDVAKERKFTF